MSVILWLLSGFMAVLSILVYWHSPMVEIHPTVLSLSDSSSKALEAAKRMKWNDARLLFQGQIIGPESITNDPLTGAIFTGTHEGYVWKIDKDLTKAEIVVRTGEDHRECGSHEYSKVCGRVLGLRFVAGDILIVADAYLGIIAINITSKTKEVLVHSDQDDLTKSLKIFNSVDVSVDGIVYFTVSSMRWTLHDFIYSFMEVDSTGRVYSYNIVTKELRLLATNIAFANGIVVTHEGDSLLVAELTRRRILKIDIRDPTKISTFLDNLPGPPDNLKKLESGTYFVSLPDLDTSQIHRYMFNHPCLSALAAWFLPKSVLFKAILFQSLVLEFDGSGQIISAIDGSNKNISFITEANKINGRIFLGSIVSHHLAVIDTA